MKLKRVTFDGALQCRQANRVGTAAMRRITGAMTAGIVGQPAAGRLLLCPWAILHVVFDHSSPGYLPTGGAFSSVSRYEMKSKWFDFAEFVLCAFIMFGQSALISGFIFLLWLILVRS